MLPKRLARLEVLLPAHGVRVLVARGVRARLLGLAGLSDLPAGWALLLPRCRSVHTFWMRFPLDLVFLDRRGRPLAAAWDVGPGRVVRRRGAAAVLEARAGDPAVRAMIAAMAEEARREETRARLLAGLSPRRRIYRDPFNEYFVFILSAAGASVVVPILLLIAQGLSDKWGLLPFLAVSVALEELLIFGVGRPQMKPQERVGWALLWGTAALALGASFYYLVVDPLL